MNDAVQLKAMIIPFVMDDRIQELCVDGVSDSRCARSAVEHEVRDVGYRRLEVLWLPEEGTAAFRWSASNCLLNLFEGLRGKSDLHDVERVALRVAAQVPSLIVRMIFHNPVN